MKLRENNYPRCDPAFARVFSLKLTWPPAHTIDNASSPRGRSPDMSAAQNAARVL